jgi:predicted ATPase/DNA-binding CsgD family transcriptional regulator
VNPAFPPPAGGGLPVEISPFVGRKEDLARLSSLLGDPAVRLVTILGPGGIGKTRLALELARLLLPAFTDGVVFVSLSDLHAPADLLPALSAALGIQLLPGSDLRRAVFDHLSTRRMLLILDNFEHLLDGALLVRDLLAAAPQVKMLVTSHEKLNLTSESIYHLQGLALPPEDAVPAAGEYDAVRLFVQKARQASPGFALSSANAPDVLRACRLVDGMPLGILLAAAWVELFSVQEIAGEIEHNLDFLSGQPRDLPPRHRSLRAVFDSSFERLEKNLQDIFIRLAVFRAGFTLAAARKVAAADLPALLALVDKSLLRRDPASGRYSLHGLLGQFAAEKLAAAGEIPALRNAHAAFYLGFLNRSARPLKSEGQIAAANAIQADFENIRFAWAWAVEQGDVSAIRSASGPLYAYCDMRDRSHEGEALFRQAWQGLSPPPGQAPDPVLALVVLSWYDLHLYIDRRVAVDELVALAQECRQQAQLAGDQQALAASLVLLGALEEKKLSYATALPYYQQGFQADPSLDDFYWVNIRIGLAYQAMGQYEPAIQAFQQSLKLGQAVGERVKMGWSLVNTGETLFLKGDASAAAVCLRQALDLFTETGTPSGVLWVSRSLGRVALSEGDRAAAKELAETAFQLARQLHSTYWISKVDELFQQIHTEPVPARPKAGQALVEPLSERELEVLQLLKSDMSGPEIASRLMVSLNTVRYHTKNIYQKLQVNTRREALARARELGL